MDTLKNSSDYIKKKYFFINSAFQIQDPTYKKWMMNCPKPLKEFQGHKSK